ncbi:MAG: helix-turn-helix domain-containing protein [Desulfovibrionaceae bacterium]
MAGSETPRLYTIQEVADILRVHPRTIYRLIRDADLRAIKVGSQWRIAESALFEFFDKGGQALRARLKREKGPRQLKLPLDEDNEQR